VYEWVLQPKKLLRKFRCLPDSVWGGDFDHYKHYLSNTLQHYMAVNRQIHQNHSFAAIHNITATC
jgi:hypothetical protein